MDRIAEIQRRHQAEVIALVQSIEDPVERITFIREFADDELELGAKLAALHRSAVRELCTTMKRVDVASTLGVTVQRVGQLLND